MPEGLQYALSGKISSGPRPRVSIVTYDMGPSLYSGRYIQEALTNSLDLDDSNNKRHMHLLLFANDVNNFELNRRNDVTVYDFVRNPVVNLENLYETLSGNVISRPGRSHILIIDDYSLFSILTTARNAKLEAHFLRGISKRFRKMFIFFGKNSLATDEIGVIYDAATEIAYLQSCHEVTGGVSNDGPKFTCDLLKIRSDRRVSHEKTVFQVINNEIQEKLVYDTIDKGDNSGAEVLKNLTTFKLTLEDGERESKNNLHLPYFEAQKTSLEDPENFDDFDEDEEDEEV